jgi:hypothetical protein
MQALLNRHRQGLAPRPPPAPLINLQHAITHMPVATPSEITDNLKTWYELLEGEEPEMGAMVVAQMYAAMNTELRSSGNQHGMGPQFLLYNTGDNQFHLLSCLFERPASIPDMPADSEFAQTPFIAVLENRDSLDEDWLYGPITANELFGKRSHKLPTWATIKQPVRETGTKHGLAMPKNGAETVFFPGVAIVRTIHFHSHG